MVSVEVVENILRDRLSSLIPVHWIDKVLEEIKEQGDREQLELGLDK
jgi:hypothetical protein